MEFADERDLAEQLRIGTQSAWLTIYDRYAEEVWSYVARRLPADRQAVADAVQATFLAAASHARYYHPARGSLRNWLLGIARGEIAAHYRRTVGIRARFRLLLSRLGLNGRAQEVLAAETDGPDLRLAACETAERVRTALRMVPPEQRLALIELYVEERSVEEIAKLLERSPGAIRSLLARGRQSFRIAYAAVQRNQQPTGGCSDVTESQESA